MKAPDFASVTIFAEDIREEVGGQISMIGLLSDNLAVPQIPSLLPKLAVYTRTLLSAEGEPKGDLVLTLRHQDGEKIAENVISKDMIDSTAVVSRQQGAPFHTLLSRLVAAPFPISREGRLFLVASYGGEDILTGFLNIEIGTPPAEPEGAEQAH